MAKIGSIKAEYEHADVGDRGERLRAATAEYFAKEVEDKLNISWWETSQSFSLSSAADVLNSSADWLRYQVASPLTNAAGAAGPAASVFAGMGANFATAALTAPLGSTARIFEVVGVAVGLATGNLWGARSPPGL